MEIADIDLKELIEIETGNRFNREGAICCPFHNEKTPSLKVKFLSNANKERYKCYGCDAEGDAIDFIVRTRNLNYAEAREYLGIPLEKTKQELEIDKIKGYISWEIKTLDYRKGLELLGVFSFVDRDNRAMYYKAKFKAPDGKKSLSYYHINEEDKVKNSRNGEELLYNLYNVIVGVREYKTIIITEGEKDSNSLNSLFRNKDYVATSVKGVKDFSFLHGAKIFVCGDTGDAGRKYIEKIKFELLADSTVFKIINLQGIKQLGDNKDITDWLESGHTKSDLFKAFKRSLDLKNEFELQQDFGGIYKSVKVKSDSIDYTKTYICNFTLLEATRINFVDKESEGVKLTLKSCTGATITRMDTATVFDDMKSFKNFLGTLDLSFSGSIADLTMLKAWINNYFALDVEEVHTGVKFANINDTRVLITNDGAISKGKINKTIKSEDGAEIKISDIEEITAKEIIEVKKNLFTFATVEKTISIVGSVASYLADGQSQTLNTKNHFLFIIGESGGGKSTILEKVIAPMLNYPLKDKNSIGDITPFALIKNLSEGNYPSIFDEYKPSQMDKYKLPKLSGIFRNLYDRASISRGDKSFKNKSFQLTRPMILAGEECYPNSEKALMERSCIIYISKRERTEKHIESMKWLTENEILLNKLGRSLIETVLELSIEDYKNIRKKVSSDIERLKDRPLDTAINICTGVEIFNLLLKKLCVKQISNYTECIVKNIESEVLEDREEALSQVELMLKQYNSMIEDDRALNVGGVIQRRDDGLFIKSSEMLNQISEHLRKVGSTWVPLDIKDFKKQAKKAGYLTGFSNKAINIGTGLERKTVKYDTCDIKRFRELDVTQIIELEMEEVIDMNNVIPFK
jgi:hypothetical protein